MWNDWYDSQTVQKKRSADVYRTAHRERLSENRFMLRYRPSMNSFDELLELLREHVTTKTKKNMHRKSSKSIRTPINTLILKGFTFVEDFVSLF
jgi:hypothetical protein